MKVESSNLSGPVFVFYSLAAQERFISSSANVGRRDGYMLTDSDITRLAELFIDSVKNNCQGEVAILFSGGIDSTAIATVAKRYTTPLLITAGVEGSSDLEAARKIAAELGLPHKAVVLTEAEIISVYKKCYKIRKGELNKVELMVPVFKCCREAARAGKWRILSGSGAEELFIGYDRFFKYKGKKLENLLKKEIKELPSGDCEGQDLVAKNFGMRAAYPFLYPPFVDAILAMPLSERLGTLENKKPLLRKIAAKLGMPQCAIDRKKKAMQYGSGVHKILVKNIKQIEEELRVKEELKQRKRDQAAERFPNRRKYPR